MKQECADIHSHRIGQRYDERRGDGMDELEFKEYIVEKYTAEKVLDEIFP